jgi:hypothetical protein
MSLLWDREQMVSNEEVNPRPLAGLAAHGGSGGFLRPQLSKTRPLVDCATAPHKSSGYFFHA